MHRSTSTAHIATECHQRAPSKRSKVSSSVEEVSEACSDEECSVRVVIDDEEDRDSESEDLKVGHHSDRDVTGFRKLLLLAQTERAAQAS